MSMSPQPRLSCGSCKSRKRKCDRKLPKCSLCSSKNILCAYPVLSSRRRHDLVPSRQHPSPHPTVTALGPSTAGTSAPTTNFLPVFYLDWFLFQNCNVEIPALHLPFPSYVSRLIGDVENWKEIAVDFFASIHKWMPIISKKRFYEHVPDHCMQLRSDYALLILCMELVMWIPYEQSPRTPAYLAAKQFYLHLEMQGCVSVQILQAQILIAHFEFGHAIFPSAAVSIDACVRYGVALGIDWNTKCPRKIPFSWIDREEQNRVWWAVVILNCITLTGYPKRPSLIENPSSDILLPCNDTAWDEGEMPPKTLGILQPRSNQDLGHFALLAEGTRLIGQVLKHVSSQNFNEPLHNEEALLLHRALRALETVVEFEGRQNTLEIMNETTLCSIALVILHEAHTSRMTVLAEQFSQDHDATHVTEAVQRSRQAALKNSSLPTIHSCVKEASPFLTTLLYQAAITNLRLDRELGTTDSSEAFAVLKAALRDFNSRWKSSGAYLEMLEARELSSIIAHYPSRIIEDIRPRIFPYNPRMSLV